MKPTAEETFNQAVEWVTKEIKKEILASPGGGKPPKTVSKATK